MGKTVAPFIPAAGKAHLSMLITIFYESNPLLDVDSDSWIDLLNPASHDAILLSFAAHPTLKFSSA